MFKVLFYLILFSFFCQIKILAKDNSTQELIKTRSLTGSPIFSMINISNFSSYMRYDGQSARNPFTDNSGGYYPRGTVGVIYCDGIIWGGYVKEAADTLLRVGGQTYRVGTSPGWIVNGNPIDPLNERVRIYRIRDDWSTLTHSQVKQDAAELNGIDSSEVTELMTQEIIDQYAKDWEEWPVDLGAPYIDINENGQWDGPDIDKPGIGEADQVIWFAINDLDENCTKYLYGSPPIGLEVQVLIWAYNQPGSMIGQFYYKRYKIINKSGMTIDSLFIAQFSDLDIGDYRNDLAGCNQDLQLGYTYNGEATDAGFNEFGLAPAAIGYKFLQGPIVPSIGDTAIFNFKTLPDHKNLTMTSFSYFAAGSEISDPILGEYDGTLQWYNMLNGYKPTTDLENPTPYTHGSGPNQGQATKFPLNGDPVQGTGDIDGEGNNLSMGDRRIVISSGPFNMQPGDEQEFIIAVIGGMGGNYLTSLTDLFNTASYIKIDTLNVSFTSINNPDLVAPISFALKQNYPNPFNPITTIEYAIPQNTQVKLEIYNILGQKVSTLINGFRKSGNYKVKWDGQQFASGMYIIRLQAGKQVELKKMLLLK
jgi:hypothetical protein